MESKTDEFDPNFTIEENFPKILRPSDEVDMLDCKIDVSNTTDVIVLDTVKEEFIRFYYLDHHHVYNKL